TIIEALLRRERQLLKKTREFRQTANDDKERRYEISRLLEQNSKAFRMLLAGLSRPAGLESYREALEALTLVANAGWAQLALCDEKGKVTERILAAHPTTQPHPPNYLAEQYMQQVVTGNAIVNRPGNAAALADDSVLGSVRKRQPAFLGHP